MKDIPNKELQKEALVWPDAEYGKIPGACFQTYSHQHISSKVHNKAASAPPPSLAHYPLQRRLSQVESCIRASSHQLQLLLPSKALSEPQRYLKEQKLWSSSCLAMCTGVPTQQSRQLDYPAFSHTQARFSDIPRVRVRLTFNINNKGFHNPKNYSGPRRIRGKAIISCCKNVLLTSLWLNQLFALARVYVHTNIWVRSTFQDAAGQRVFFGGGECVKGGRKGRSKWNKEQHLLKL